jgi:glucosamine--fructose-6-phosphate aminotransferase (isomerizing)
MSLMLAEIAEQPAALERTIAEERAKIAKLGNVLKTRDIDLIVLVARGSSDNAALFGRYLLEITTGIPVSLSAPSVHTIYNAELRLDHALVVGVSQSGEGEDINRVLENARRSGAYTVGITNEPRSSMTSLVDETLLTHGGRERSVAATKTFTGQMLLFYMLPPSWPGTRRRFHMKQFRSLLRPRSNRNRPYSSWCSVTCSWKTASSLDAVSLTRMHTSWL